MERSYGIGVSGLATVTSTPSPQNIAVARDEKTRERERETARDFREIDFFDPIQSLRITKIEASLEWTAAKSAMQMG